MIEVSKGSVLREGSNILRRHVVSGALIGLVLLHPWTMAIYGFEFSEDRPSISGALEVIFTRMFLSFDPIMWGMAITFVLLGSMLGLGSGWYYQTHRRKGRSLAVPEQARQQSLRTLIEEGESNLLEFKSSMRWDWKQAKLNKALEHAVVKTLAGFMNGIGGTLLLGIEDNGTVIGLDPDYATLKKPGRDGYEQHLMHLIASRLRANFCDLVRLSFHTLEGKDVCRVKVDASDRPAYVHQGDQARYYLRTGNSTRELNTKEAVEHAARRFLRSR